MSMVSLRPIAEVPRSAGAPFQLRLLGRFDLIGGSPAALGGTGQRLVALLAINAGTVARWQAGQTLYSHTSDAHAARNLRALLWRLHRCCPGMIAATGAEIRLGAEVDYWQAASAARRLLDPAANLTRDELGETTWTRLREDLLPGWPESWLVNERERFHQLRLHALEAMCARLTSAGLHAAAIDTGLSVVGADPLRESARRALIDAYLAEGNICEAVRQFGTFRDLLRDELGLRPTEDLRQHLVAVAEQADGPAKPPLPSAS